jgi:Ankyrin repeat
MIRGYIAYRFDTLKSGYWNKSTALQLASYGKYLKRIVEKGNPKMLMEFLSCGVAINPATTNGCTLLHEICQRNDVMLFNVILECFGKICTGINATNKNPIQICDGNGRTPLHYVCSSINPSFEIVDKIWQLDPHLVFMADSNGILPLECIPQETWPQWIRFFNENLWGYYPYHDINQDGPPSVPPLTLVPPHTFSLPTPDLILPIAVATLVANGHMIPRKAITHAIVRMRPEDHSIADDDGSCASLGEKDILSFLTTFHSENKKDIMLRSCDLSDVATEIYQQKQHSKMTSSSTMLPPDRV